jgi:hypothetical protein
MSTPFPLGRKVEHDQRSRAFAFTPRLATTVVKKTWRRYGDVLDQGQLGSCTGNAMTHALNSLPLHKTGTTVWKEATAVMIYSAATALDDFPGAYPPDDTGSSGLGVCKAAVNMGLITRYDWAFGFDHTLQTLMTGPVLVGTNWYEGMFYPNSSGVVTISGNPAGGHEYLLVGVDPGKKLLTFQNSWSNLWGLNGRFLMSYDSFKRLLSEDGDAVIARRT